MLMNHADLQIVGIVRIVDLDDLAILPDDTAVWLVKAKQDAHQGAFPCSVFTEQGMDFTAPQLQSHMIGWPGHRGILW